MVEANIEPSEAPCFETARPGETPETAVDVLDEPNHTVEFRNQYASVLRPFLPCGVVSQWHIHSKDTLYVFIHSCDMSLQNVGKDTRPYTAMAGDWWVIEHSKDPLVHRCGCLDSKRWCHIVVAQFEPPPPAPRPLANRICFLEQQGCNVEFLNEVKSCRAYRWIIPQADFAEGEEPKTAHLSSSRPSVWILVNAATLYITVTEDGSQRPEVPPIAKYHPPGRSPEFVPGFEPTGSPPCDAPSGCRLPTPRYYPAGHWFWLDAGTVKVQNFGNMAMMIIGETRTGN